MKKVLPNIIDASQSAFITGRGLLDNVLVANEVVEEIKRRKRSRVIVKVDFEKAYDFVSWEFLYYMMSRVGFYNKWIMWMKGYLESSTISVLENGSPTQEFKPTRGLRQVDPLAPFLFLIVAEGLAGLVRNSITKQVYKGLKVGKNNVGVNLLQFADDTLFVCEANLQNIMAIKSILRCFEIGLGLKVNFHKSKIGDLVVDKNVIQRYSKVLNYNRFNHMRGPRFRYKISIGSSTSKLSQLGPIF